MNGLAIRVLGDVEVTVDGEPIQVDTRKATALLAYLAVTGSTASRDHLSNLMWSELAADRARGALRRTLSVVRSALDGRWLEAETDRLRLKGPLWLDLEEADNARNSVIGHGHERESLCERCLEPLEQAASLYRGEFMEGFSLRDSPQFELWQLQEADRVRHQHTSTLRMLADAAALRKDYERAVAAARQRVNLSPLDEAAHRQLMLMLVWAGDRAGALRQYREAVRILDEELGVPPLPETSELEDRILCDDIPEPPGRPEEKPGSPPTVSDTPDRSAMVGRRLELTRLRALVEQGGGRVAAIVGNPGVGKTRLADELSGWASARSRSVARARTYEGESALPLVLVGEALRAALDQWESPPPLDGRAAAEASRLLPELASGDVPPATADPAGQSRFLDGVSRVLSTLLGEGGVLILDDLQWADSASVDLLAYLLRRPARFPICSVLIWRSNPAAAHPLRSVVEEQVDAGRGLVIDLQPLSHEEMRELAVRVHPEITDQANQQVAEGSGGNPLVALQYLRMLNPSTGELPEATSLRPEVTQARLRGVSQLARQVLAGASVIGRAFDPDDVRAASGRSDEETAAALDELMAADVLSEDDDGLIDFTHDLVRLEVREALSAVRRRLLHGRLADHLERKHRAGGVTLAGRIAHHLEEAGRLQEAAAYRLDAGDQARGVYAHQEAMTHYQAALAHGHPDLVRIRTAIADLQTLAGDYSAALDSYRIAASRATGAKLAEIEHRLGEINGRLGRWELADHHFQAATAGLDDPRRLIDLHIDWARMCRHMGDEPAARDKVATAVGLAEAATGTTPPMVAIMEGLFDEDTVAGESRVRRGLELARSTADSGAEATALTALALLARRRGELPTAIERTETALALVTRIGDRHRQATLHDLLADLFHETGEEEDAMEQLTQAVALFAEVGTGGLEPAIWKTTPW
ncbi:MAG TPA: AAA family ATPase [Acidimicrobiia bacterium]|nr:AAA family ATPase [Acidimicrobiia bacterium]